MLSLFAYVIINCIIFLFLIRKKYKVVAVAHAVLFAILSVGFLFSGAIPEVLPALNNVFGIKNVILLRKSLLGINGVSIAPFLVMELVTILLSVVAYFISVTKIVNVLSIHKSKRYNFGSKKRYEKVCFIQEYVPVSIFKLYCRYLC